MAEVLAGKATLKAIREITFSILNEPSYFEASFQLYPCGIDIYSLERYVYLPFKKTTFYWWWFACLIIISLAAASLVWTFLKVYDVYKLAQLENKHCICKDQNRASQTWSFLIYYATPHQATSLNLFIYSTLCFMV